LQETHDRRLGGKFKKMQKAFGRRSVSPNELRMSSGIIEVCRQLTINRVKVTVLLFVIMKVA
jgi:hypothetical protein